MRIDAFAHALPPRYHARVRELLEARGDETLDLAQIGNVHHSGGTLPMIAGRLKYRPPVRGEEPTRSTAGCPVSP